MAKFMSEKLKTRNSALVNLLFEILASSLKKLISELEVRS